MFLYAYGYMFAHTNIYIFIYLFTYIDTYIYTDPYTFMHIYRNQNYYVYVSLPFPFLCLSLSYTHTLSIFSSPLMLGPLVITSLFSFLFHLSAPHTFLLSASQEPIKDKGIVFCNCSVSILKIALFSC